MTTDNAPRTIGVLICSYRRPESLLRGLAMLATQDRAPDQVTVVVRAEDQPTHAALDRRPDDGLALSRVVVTTPGTVHALNAGLAAASTDVIAITDDDTVPRQDWTARILAHFQSEPRLGGLGGRDWMHQNGEVDGRSAKVVGRLQWFGRMIGNHHLGAGSVQSVDMLKGANMSYRRDAIAGVRFDERLRGDGAQPAEDIAFSMTVKAAGWLLWYDPAVAVDHFVGDRSEPRHYAGIAPVIDKSGLQTYAHNEVVALWLPLRTVSRRLAYVVWSALVGTKVSPGLLQAILMTRRLGLPSWQRYASIQRGKLAGLGTVLSGPGTPVVPGRHASERRTDDGSGPGRSAVQGG